MRMGPYEDSLQTLMWVFNARPGARRKVHLR